MMHAKLAVRISFLVLLAAFLILSGCSKEDERIPADVSPPSAITDLAASTGTLSNGDIDLAWTAPSEDGVYGGPATAYEVRYSTAAITDANWTSAAVFPQTWTPLGPGSGESRTLQSLTPGLVYFVALRAVDDAGNVSPLSNVASASSLLIDLAPSAVTDLAASPGTTQEGIIDLTWTATGEDGSGGGAASQYEVRFSTSSIDAANWSAATLYTQSWTPVAPGNAESHSLTGLTPATTYYIALKVMDAASQYSPLSNVASAQASTDTFPPGAVADLAAFPSTTAGAVDLTWTAPGDDGTTGTAASYEVRHSSSPINAGNFASATLYSQSWTPLSGGSAESRTLTGFTQGATIYFALRASDEVPNVSAVSNCASTTTTVAGTFTVVVGPQNPPGSAATPLGNVGVLQLLAVNTASEAMSVHSVSFTETGTANLGAVQFALLMLDNGTTAGAWDSGDGYVDNQVRNFSGSTLTFTPTTAHNVAAGTSEAWLLVYRFNKASTGAFQASITPATQITVTGFTSGNPVTPSGPAITGNAFSFAGPVPTAWYTIGASGGPGTRLFHSAVYDGPNQRILFFGGQTGGGGGSETNAVHALSTQAIGSETWTALSPANSPPPARHGHVAVYDSTGQRMIIYGGKDGTGAVLNDVWALSLSGGGNGSWNQISPGGTVLPGLYRAAAVYDPAADEIILFGGIDGSANYYNNTYVLGLSSPSWRLQATSSTPTTRQGHMAALDPSTGSMVVFSGLGAPLFPPPMWTNYQTDTVVLNLSTWTWTTACTSPSMPVQRMGGVMSMDTVSGCAFLFGGVGGTTVGGPLNDVAFYDFANQSWCTAALTGTPHGAGEGAAGAYDTANGRLIVQGGQDSGTHEVR